MSRNVLVTLCCLMLVALDASQLPPTPRYNLSVLEDLAFAVQERILSKTIGPHSTLRDTLVLFKVGTRAVNRLY